MMPACTGPTGIWCRPSPSAGRNGIAAAAGCAASAAAAPCRARPSRAPQARAVEVAHRALEADRRRRAAGRPKGSGCPAQASCEQLDLRRRLDAAPCAHDAGLAPQAEQRSVAPQSQAAAARPACQALAASHERWRSVHAQFPASVATYWNQATSAGGSQMPATSTSARCSADRQERGLDRVVAPVGLAEGEAVQPQEQRAEARPAGARPRRMASTGARAKVEVTIRNSLMNRPSGGRPAIATTPRPRLQPSTGCDDGQAADVGHASACP